MNTAAAALAQATIAGVVRDSSGAVLPGDFHISARKTYGHLSAGMIASVRELGVLQPVLVRTTDQPDRFEVPLMSSGQEAIVDVVPPDRYEPDIGPDPDVDPLRVALAVVNAGDAPFDFAAALHTLGTHLHTNRVPHAVLSSTLPARAWQAAIAACSPYGPSALPARSARSASGRCRRPPATTATASPRIRT